MTTLSKIEKKVLRQIAKDENNAVNGDIESAENRSDLETFVNVDAWRRQLKMSEAKCKGYLGDLTKKQMVVIDGDTLSFTESGYQALFDGKTNGKSNSGEQTAVEPIRDLKHIEAIKKLLSNEPRNLLLFTIGINSGIRTGDILQLKVKQVKGVKVGDEIRIKESKTGKTNVIGINKNIYKALKGYLSTTDLSDDDYLFKSRKGRRPLTTTAVNNLIKKWTAAINLKGNYGAHTLRKTYGYSNRTVHGVGFDVLCKRFNHSSPAITQRYLGITDNEVSSILMNEI